MTLTTVSCKQGGLGITTLNIHNSRTGERPVFFYLGGIMRKKKADKHEPVTDKWPFKENFRCKTCRSQARIHPNIFGVWGCLNCGFSTVFIYSMFEKGKPRKETS
jgi:uncharacterized protein (DUF2225 family)